MLGKYEQINTRVLSITRSSPPPLDLSGRSVLWAGDSLYSSWHCVETMITAERPVSSGIWFSLLANPCLTSLGWLFKHPRFCLVEWMGPLQFTLPILCDPQTSSAANKCQLLRERTSEVRTAKCWAQAHVLKVRYLLAKDTCISLADEKLRSEPVQHRLSSFS